MKGDQLSRQVQIEVRKYYKEASGFARSEEGPDTDERTERRGPNQRSFTPH